MGQLIFLILFVVALIAGISAYLPGSQKPVNPMVFISDQSGYTTTEERNRKRMEQANITTSQGMIQVRRQMQEIAAKQKNFSDMLVEEERVLKNTGQQASLILAEAQKQAPKDQQDILRLKGLGSTLEDQQRLLVEHGQDLIALNDRIIRNRDWIHDQMDLIDTNNQTTQQIKLQGQYIALKDQSATFFDKVTQYNQQVQQYMQETQNQLNDAANHIVYDNSLQQQVVKEKIQSLMDRQHEEMVKLSESREKSQSLMRDQQERWTLSQELLNDSIRHSKELIGQERRNAKERQIQLQQQIQDQMQRIKDKQ